ncbi:DMT family transporter [Verrucomicrobiaceae bacterium 227]
MPFFRRPLLPALICALLWGSSFPVIKSVFHHWDQQGLQVTLPILFLFAGTRFGIAGLGLIAVGKDTRSQIKATSWKPLAGLALAQTFFQYVFLYQAIAISSASLTALLVATGSFWWVILAPLILKSPKPSLRQWAGLTLGGIGVCLAVYAPGSGAGNPILGAILMLTATASGAIGIILFSKINPSMSSINATGLSLLVGGLALIGTGARDFGSLAEMFTPPVLLATLWLAFVSASAFTMWNHLSTIFPVSLLASYRFLIPVCGVIESLLFLTGESPGWGLLIGGPLVILSMVIARRSTLKTPP